MSGPSAFSDGSALLLGDDGHHDNDLQNWSSLIGIVTAIVGNVLIALALNVQRYAHIRLNRERNHNRSRAKEALRQVQNGNSNGGGYGTLGTNGNSSNDNSSSRRHVTGNGDGLVDPSESDPLTTSFHSEDTSTSDRSDDEDKTDSTYLKSPYWWMGQVLITVGELGNFLAYGFAPASIVSPLGVVALISNCIIAPILFKEKFRPRDFWGVVIAVGGVVTVVLSANTQETKLDPDGVWEHITTIEFEVYLAVTISLIVILMWASPRYGNRTILIDLGLVGLFGKCISKLPGLATMIPRFANRLVLGGYTALSTKGVSSMLSATLLRAFTTPVTYALLFILLSTAVMQVRYVNKALQRFDSTQVIPIQFVTFTLCVIVGSAVLYRDFERTSAKQGVKFIGGCLLTFFGVFLITSGRPRHDEDEETLSDVEGVEETMRMAAQDPSRPAPQPISSPSSSRRSSKASRLSYFTPDPKLYGRSHETGVPTARAAGGQDARTPPVPEDAPLLSNPWGDEDQAISTPVGVRTISDYSVPTLATFSATPSEPCTPSREVSTPFPFPSQPDVSATPRPMLSLPANAQRPHSHQFSGPVFSPSPLSSTVSAVVKDTLLRNAGNPILKRPSVKRLRTSIRASLFMSEEEIRAQQETEAEAHRRRLASRSQDHITHFPDPVEAEQLASHPDSPSGSGRRPRSLSDTLGQMFSVKRKKKSRAADVEDDHV